MDDIAKLMRDRLVAHSRTAGRWYDISNADGADGNTAVLRIYDEISWFGIDAEQFAQDLTMVSTPNIEVQINSPGGSVFDGVAIFNALRAHSAHVTTRVDGVAASIASVIAQAGDHRVMLSGAQMMIHQARGVAIGNAADMRAFADLLDRQNQNIVNIYASRSGKDAAEFMALLDDGADHWMGAQEAVDMGLADEVVDPAPKGKPEAKAEPQVDMTALADALERVNAALAGTTPAPAPTTETSPAGEREEQDPAIEAAVSREEAERFLASLTLLKEAP